MNSRITNGPAERIFRGKVLGKFDVEYFRCEETGFIQTEHPYWLEEAYTDAIASLDIGLLSRNIEKVELADQILSNMTDPNQRLLDYGGGYGVFVRLMRDRGHQFELFDPHCNPMFARRHRVTELGDAEQTYACVTAWEVVEHLADPVATFSQLFDLSDRLLFSTVLVPTPSPKSIDDWWYFAPETGQHISFFTLDSLKWIANAFQMHLYSDGSANHLFSKQSLPADPFKAKPWQALAQWFLDKSDRFGPWSKSRKNHRQNLREADYQAILRELQ